MWSDAAREAAAEARGAHAQGTAVVGMPTVKQIATELQRRGYRLDHVSGAFKSAYLSHPITDKQIRVSNHTLGTKNNERQGGSWATNIVIDPGLSLDDHIHAAEDEDYANSAGGFGEGYSYQEWRDK